MNETLIIKSAVKTNSTIKLTDCPMASGEILETVCRLFTNGVTSGNRAIKVVGNNVTYNSDAVTSGDLYCVSYRDGGFYVGARVSEDYEPKEGDWWCYYTVTKTIKYNIDSSGGGYADLLRGEDIGLFLDTAYNPNEYRWYFTFLKDGVIVNTYNLVSNSEFYFLTVDANNSYSLTNANSYQGKLLKYPLPSTNILNNKSLIGYTNNSTTYNNKGTVFRKLGTPNITEKVSILLWKPITASDILAYQATGHMGHLMVGNASVTHPRNNTSKFIFGSDAYPTFNNTWDFNTKYLLIVTDENGDIYNLQQVSRIPFYVRQPGESTQIASCYIKVDYINGCLIMTETLAEKLDEEYLDIASYNYINGYQNNTSLPTSYTVYKIPILQDNRSATLNALNTNLLNSNQTDVQPINDETDG